MKLVCTPCGERFDSGVKLPMPVNAYVKYMEAVKCPKCGAGLKSLSIATNNPGGLK
jgi:transcription elongation factor Elf1